jgi:hypothetical protein
MIISPLFLILQIVRNCGPGTFSIFLYFRSTISSVSGGFFGLDQIPGQISVMITAIMVPIHDSTRRSAAFRMGFNAGLRLDVTMITATVIDARRA